MTAKSEFNRIFRESFTVSGKWLEWFMAEVVDAGDVLVEMADDKAVAAMLSSEYPMVFHGTELSSVYFSCVATAKNERGKGYMRRLMERALKESYAKGDDFAVLIPAERRLYDLYDRFGFATVFYADELRYTALHSFAAGDGFRLVEPSYEMFARLEALRTCGIRHTERHFGQILADLRLDGGIVAAVSDGGEGEAMAFVKINAEVKVVDILASSHQAAETALAHLRKEAQEKPFVVMGIPASRNSSLLPVGMARVVNAESVLAAVAAAQPGIEQAIRVNDPIIAENNAVFHLGNGECRRQERSCQKLALDVTADVLTKILFSSKRMGEVFGIASCRPAMSLMLD